MDVSSESGDSACYSDISSESDVDSFSDVSDFSDDGAYETETKRLTSLCFYERGLRDFLKQTLTLLNVVVEPRNTRFVGKECDNQ